jgi:predicted glycosyltransferase
MRILFDIGHPGHVHLFKNLAHLFMKKGAEVLFTCREKENETALLKAGNLPYKCFGKHYKTFSGKLWGLLEFDTKMVATILSFKPDLLISHGSIYAAHAAFLTGRKHLSMEDSGNMEQIVLYRPFTDVILSPDVLPEKLGSKQIRYKGYHEIAYLHPDFFTPDNAVYRWLGLDDNEPFAIFRFVSWNATHDVGHKGLTAGDKAELVSTLSKKMKVFISAESELPEALESYRLNLAPEQLHHALYFASIVVSEGATIASESGVLGTPAVYINSIERSYCQDQEKYGLVYNTSDSENVKKCVTQILKMDRNIFRERRETLLKDKINLTPFLYRFIVDRYIDKKGEYSFQNFN